MSKVSKQLAGLGLGALGSCTLVLLAAAPVLAADLAYPPYLGEDPGPAYREERVEEALPPPPPRPVYGPRFAAGPYAAPPPPPEECRTIVKRRVDEFGEEIVRRVRICDGPAYPPGPRLRPSFYRSPLPPADIPDERWPGPPRW